MIRISADRCQGCGECANICHEHCISLVDQVVNIHYDFCSTCCQCIAICPSQALSWNNIKPEPFNDQLLPTDNQIKELLKQRHTIRAFSREKPDRKLIEEIVNMGAWAPTHHYSFRAIVVDDDTILDQLDTALYNYVKKIYRFLYKPKIVNWLVKTIASRYRGEYLRAKPKLEKSLASGKGYQSIPPVIIFVVGDKRAPLSLESAQYLLYNMIMLAASRKLGTRILVGNQMFINRHKRFRHKINLSGRERIYGMLGLGYPQPTFRNKVAGKNLKIQWNR